MGEKNTFPFSSSRFLVGKLIMELFLILRGLLNMSAWHNFVEI